MARAEKGHEINKLEELKTEHTELEEEERTLMKEIEEYNKSIERDKAMTQSLESEIDRLEGETNEKLQQLRAEQRFKSLSGYGSVASLNDAILSTTGQAPDMDVFHTSLQFSKTPSSIQTNDGGFLNETMKTPTQGYNLADESYDNSENGGGNPSQHGPYESNNSNSQDGGGYQE